MRYIIAILSVVFVCSLGAQPLTVGIISTDPYTHELASGAPVSFVNLVNYATADGTVDHASVMWSATCANAFKIVFLRNSSLASVSSFTVVATRGPFNAVMGRNDVLLTPPVAVSRLDLIGVVQLLPVATCGSVLLQDTPDQGGYRLRTYNDISLTEGTIGTSPHYWAGAILGAVAYSGDPFLVCVLPAVGAVAGANAFFRTSLQLHNITTTTISGKLVFHKQGQSASASDASLALTLSPSQVLSYPDVITTMGTSGLGSLDVFTTGGSPPIVSARVYSDGGSAGTSGFTEEGLQPNEALDSWSRAVLLTPSDLTNFRMNVGVRTMDSGATLNIYTFSADGTLLSLRAGISYPPNYFEQVSVNQFIGGNVAPGGTIVIGVNFPGRAFIYSTITDNRTSDSSMRMATASH